MHRILIVDDEDEIREELADYLQRKGYETSCAADGLDAWELFNVESIDGIVTDVKMPRVDGHELINLIRESNSDTPIIAMTGHYSAEDLDKLSMAGASMTIKKPIHLRSLIDSLQKFLAT